VFDVVVPKLNNNDQSYTLLDWLVENGQQVRMGDPLAELETSKAQTELEATQDGIVHRLVENRTECRHGQVIARLFTTEEERQRALATEPGPAAPDTRPESDIVITNGARALAEELGIGPAQLHGIGKKIVKREDVRQFAASGSTDNGRLHVLPRTQRAIAAVVTEAHQTIPAATAVIKVQVEDALVAARQVSRQAGMLVGLPELLIKVVGELRERFPIFFAASAGDGVMRLAEAAHIGVTVDVGTGLFVPVVRDAGDRSLADIAETLLRFRTNAMEHGFHDADLAGMNIMVSLHNEPDLVLAVPIIYPGTTCVVCLAGVQSELTLDEAGEVTTGRVVNVSATYDHRAINGRDAVLFLQAVKAALEYPEGSFLRPAGR
jgi:2-oxoglutarate dehydrogenase E2 component (dihydrolipoamide succinyltransferase)